MWLFGNKVVIIIISGGGGNKFNNVGLCDKCFVFYQNNGELSELKSVLFFIFIRRRYKLVFVIRSVSIIESKVSIDDIGIQLRMSFDDMMNSLGSISEYEVVQVGVQIGFFFFDYIFIKFGLEIEVMEVFFIGKDFFFLFLNI